MSHARPPDALQPPAGPGPAPALALLAADGYPVTATEVFTRLVGLPALSALEVAPSVAQITSGSSDHAAFGLPLVDGTTSAGRADVVHHDAYPRLILVEVMVPRPNDDPGEIARWFGQFGDDSEAVIWLKDLAGHYLYVNAQYTAELGVDPARIHGRTDADLTQFEAIDGPRSKRAGGPEPVQLEYVIPAFDRRPAYTALRFSITDAAGAPRLVCGVASHADQAGVAQAECDRLLGVLDWLHGDPAALRHRQLTTWGVVADRSHRVNPPAPAVGAVPAPLPVPAPASPPLIPAEFARALESLERRVRDLETKLAGRDSDPRSIETELAADQPRVTGPAAATPWAHRGRS